MPGIHTFYDGSTVMQPISNLIGVEVDKVNFVLCMFSSLPLAFIYNKFMQANQVSRQIRTLFPLLIGLAFCFFCFGRAVKHLLANCLVSYALMYLAPSKHVHILVFIFSMGYLMVIHFYRWLILSAYYLDITGPIMVAVQKITTLAFSLHDGRARKKEDLTELQKREAIKYLTLPYFQWFMWWFIVILLIRINYYFAWTFADAVCNMSGFGFSGFDENGSAKWELCTNVKPYQVEMAQSFKETLDGWNIQTGGWLRRIAYDRTPISMRTIATYVLSATWHGVSIGYYITFFTGALFTLAAQTFRRCMRWRFVDFPKYKLVYDFVTFFSTKVALAYATYAFVTMDWDPAITVYKRVYFVVHILAIAILYVLPIFCHPQKKGITVAKEPEKNRWTMVSETDVVLKKNV
uniref:MBOAT family protein n=1 Tax=Heterorhabditis bacteriophora TaxID=37862 RepID=A0A1I7XV25_HETBA